MFDKYTWLLVSALHHNFDYAYDMKIKLSVVNTKLSPFFFISNTRIINRATKKNEQFFETIEIRNIFF